jgi:ribosomal 50S subunit-recycling heat shock protein
MVHLPISKNSWVKVIKLKDIDYDYKEENKEMVETINIKINGKEIKADAIVKDGETFLKLRAFENAGFKVGYSAENKMRTVDNEIKEIPVVVDGKETSVEAVNIADYNYTPIRSLAAALDVKVGYENRKVTLEKCY